MYILEKKADSTELPFGVVDHIQMPHRRGKFLGNNGQCIVMYSVNVVLAMQK